MLIWDDNKEMLFDMTGKVIYVAPTQNISEDNPVKIFIGTQEEAIYTMNNSFNNNGSFQGCELARYYDFEKYLNAMDILNRDIKNGENVFEWP